MLRPDPKAFPVDPPADLDDPVVIADHDWRAFVALDEMRDHWDRPGWYPGRRAYYWMVLPQSGELTRAAADHQRALAPLGMDPVPAAGLHITMTRIGDVRDVSPARIDILAAQAQAHLAQLTAANEGSHESSSPFTLAAGPLTGSRGAIRLSVAPWRPLVATHAALTRLNNKAGLPGGPPTARFRPHLGITYNNRRRPVRPVIDLVAPRRTEPIITITVSALALVELRRDDTTYIWRTLHEIPLNSTSNGSQPCR
ncbi:2'-5' RNA ligase family protein [Actinomadura atramentaria]|uniref:2'-5' RNA ligase family protein n=1 Tax=Actinomadura atramentaria TaxID=1990 RepID=UPI0003818241|nr:2'-5' RNA ligase family protein [Actinomadura atramentaria]